MMKLLIFLKLLRKSLLMGKYLPKLNGLKALTLISNLKHGYRTNKDFQNLKFVYEKIFNDVTKTKWAEGTDTDK